MLGPLQNQAVRPYAPLVKATGQALAAAKCLPVEHQGIFALHMRMRPLPGRPYEVDFFLYDFFLERFFEYLRRAIYFPFR